MVKNKSSTMSLRDNAHLSGSATSFQPETASANYTQRSSQPAPIYDDSREASATSSRPSPSIESSPSEERHHNFGGYNGWSPNSQPQYTGYLPGRSNPHENVAHRSVFAAPPPPPQATHPFVPSVQTFPNDPRRTLPAHLAQAWDPNGPALQTFTSGSQSTLPMNTQAYMSGPSQCYVPANLQSPGAQPHMNYTSAAGEPIRLMQPPNLSEQMKNSVFRAQFQAAFEAQIQRDREQNGDTAPYLGTVWPDGSVTSPEAQPGQSLFEKYNETVLKAQKPKKSLITKAFGGENTLKSPEEYIKPFCEFMTENVTVFHAVDAFEKKLTKAGFKKLSERNAWNKDIEAGGKYYTTRNGSSLIAFSVGDAYKSGNGVAMVAGHIDALTARLKPISAKKNSAGYLQLGVAPYAGALNTTWWDRDLGIAGRVLVKDSTGKIVTKLVKLGWPIARIPTLAPHFGVGMLGTNNAETQAVPIIGLDNSDLNSMDDGFKNLTLGGIGSFAATQPPKLVKAIAGELSISDYSSIVNWELELFDTQPAQTGGLDKEFIFAGRIDDKICSWAAIEGLLASVATPTKDDGIVKLVGLFDDEEIGSQLRQGAKSNFLPSVIERITESFAEGSTISNTLFQTYANSFLVSADVSHAVNPNFLGSYLEGHSPRLNVGLAIAADSNGHMTTDSVSTALMARCAEKCGSELQFFQIRNDSRSGGTVGPMLSSAMGCRSIDAGIPQLSMHSIRATVGNLDPGLGVKMFKGFLDHFEAVDKEFE